MAYVEREQEEVEERREEKEGLKCVLKVSSSEGNHCAQLGMELSKRVKNCILWYYIGHCNSICKIWGKRDHLLSFHGVNVCLNL